MTIFFYTLFENESDLKKKKTLTSKVPYGDYRIKELLITCLKKYD